MRAKQDLEFPIADADIAQTRILNNCLFEQYSQECKTAGYPRRFQRKHSTPRADASRIDSINSYEATNVQMGIKTETNMNIYVHTVLFLTEVAFA